MESQKRISEMGILCGSQRRNKELLSWLKKKKRKHIRRDELMAFLCGKTNKPLHHHMVNRSSSASWSASRQRQSLSPDVSSVSGPSPTSSHTIRSPSHHNITLTCLSLSDPPNISNCDPTGGDLQTFRDALALSGEF